MRKLWLAVVLFAAQSFGQSLTIPAQTFTTPLTINGTTIQLTITVPSQTVALPASGGASLPSGLTWSSGVLSVAGSVTATSINITGGPALPTCVSNLFLWQLVSGVLQPACYTLPPVTVSQAASPVNTFTFNP
jgi:hypothetical protein